MPRGQQNTVAFAQRPAAIKLRHRPLYPQMKIAVQIAPILKRQRRGIRAAGGAVAQGTGTDSGSRRRCCSCVSPDIAY
ncbi:hypothetical protein IE992_04550 [Klebsiella pneumoniae]|uniref:Uncharacterized protein n=1 Tax=Klebsiella pneumoniae TaxID=573 RepID=A0A927E000_KLEPN|nr:hypothetical protein [Klebsiella pneumoniae]